MIDVVVAGGGPVGLATAIRAADAGLEVVLVEPRSGPIDKACGEGVMPDALARLRSMGVDPPGIDFHGIRYVSGDRDAVARFSRGPGRGVRRTTLHEVLLQRAVDAGVRVEEGRVEGIEQGPDWIEAAGIRARYLVGADGLHSGVRRTLGLQDLVRGVPRYGIRQHFYVEPWDDVVEVHWLPTTEVYVTPVSDRVVGVAVLGAAPLSLHDSIAALPALAERLGAAKPASEPRGAGPLRQRVRARTAGGAVLVGDAAGYVDALTGEGLRVGFAEADAAVDAILRDDLPGYEGEWRRITRSYRRLTGSLLWVSSRSSLRPLIVPTARAVPSIFGRIVDSLAR